MLDSLQLLKKVVGSNPIDYSKVLERSGYKYAANILKFSQSYLSQSYFKKIVKEMKIPELSIACSVIRNWAWSHGMKGENKVDYNKMGPGSKFAFK